MKRKAQEHLHGEGSCANPVPSHNTCVSPANAFALTPCDFDLDGNHVQKLAKQLGVPQADALCEALAHVALCKIPRGIECFKEDLVEIWDAIPENLKTRDKSLPESRTLIFGANPRKPDSMTQSTLRLPRTSKLLARYVRQCCPELVFTTLSLRLNADKGPHRDLQNGPDPSFIQVLTPRGQGGDLWLADASGTSAMTIHGTRVWGRIEPCHECPVTFKSKTQLHATQPWEAPRRLVLVAWSTLSTVSYPHTCRTLEDEFCFHVPTSPWTPTCPATNIRQALQAGSAMHQGMISAGLGLIVDVKSSQEPQTSPNEIPPGPPQSQVSESLVIPKPELPHLPSQDSFTPTLREDSEEGG